MKSESINELAGALAKAQAGIRSAIKDSVNPHFGKKYADLASVWEACREQLSSNGLAVVQATATAPQGMVLVTTLLHASGQWIDSEYPVTPVKNDPQALGSALTYARRYSLSSMVGVAPDDDDGNDASAHDAPRGKTAPFLDAAAEQASRPGTVGPQPVRVNGEAVFAAAPPRALLGLLLTARGTGDGAGAEQAFATRVAVLLGTADGAMYDELFEAASAAKLTKGSPPNITCARAFKLAGARLDAGAA